MKFNNDSLLLYAVTNRLNGDFQTLPNKIEEALKGGATLVQLREKNLCEDEFIKEAVSVKKICRRFNVPLIINDNFNVALGSGADGVHLGAEDVSVDFVRKNAPKDFIVGATAKTVEQAIKAQTGGADYIGAGSIFSSETKKNATRISFEQLEKICESVCIPVVAIGGISLENIEKIKGCKVGGIAVSSAIFSAENIVKETAKLKEKAEWVVKNVKRCCF